jgi:site-specific recombinase XerD
MKPTDFSTYLTDYLAHYLPNECGVSPNTIQAYSITFTLLLRHLMVEEGIRPEKLFLRDITKLRIIGFLDWLETSRKCSVATRNARLATVHSFFRYIQYRDVQGIKEWQAILSIRFKKCASPEMAYLTADALALLLQQPDVSTKRGRRDLALLGLLYDSAARVQELADLTPADFRFEGTTTVRLTGKGRKSRIVPLADNQVKNLRQYMHESDLLTPQTGVHPLFSNPQHRKLSRAAILAIVKKYAAMARLVNAAVIPEGIGCHSFRHSKAMHMLEADINLVYIRDFLGHVSTNTTEVYARASAHKKVEALKKMNPSIVASPDMSWQRDGHLLHWLKELQRQH